LRSPLLIASEEIPLIDILKHPRLLDAGSVEFVPAVELKAAGAASKVARDEGEVRMDAEENLRLRLEARRGHHRFITAESQGARWC
jgi:hypothetical protein